jgi:hypothetical protein
MELQEKEVRLPDGTPKMQFSTVHIKKCRYLEQSGCVGMCVNMCKVRSANIYLGHEYTANQPEYLPLPLARS